jgi:hypothetical protein
MGGCAFIVNGTRDSVFIDSQPPGALVRADGEPVARTPAKIYISRGYPPRLTVEKEGFQTEEVAFPRHLDASWILFDLFLTLGIGIPIDLATGSMFNYFPDRMTVRLRPAP